MTADEIAAMQADALAGTPGNWCVDYPDELTPNIWIIAPTNSGVSKIETCDYYDGKGHILTDEDYANARRIARVPRMEAAITALTAQAEADQIKIEAQADEIERLREALSSLIQEADRIGNALSIKGVGTTVLGLKSRQARAALTVQP